METNGASPASCRVAICVATFRRPQGLLALLQSLDALVFEGTAPDVRVVVADNDEAESAREVCESAHDWLRHPLTYVVEKRRGIPQARNASLAPALGRVDWIAFADDDELADPRWLDALLRAQRASGADVVTGPFAPRFAAPVPGWIEQGGFFASRRFRDGESRPVAFTGNALVRESALAGLERLFDERLERGEDTELFRRLVQRGHRIVWADRALIHHVVEPDRARLRWILSRAFRDGVALGRIERDARTRSFGAIALHGAWCVAKGIAVAALPAPVGLAARAAALQLAAFGVGRFAALAGAD
jgi:glycosyltransferase involved in cell wall biosynthesis